MDLDITTWTLLKSDQIEGEFEGFDDEMVFELTDGSIYYQSAYKYHYHYAYRPNVKIYSDGTTMIIVPEGMDDYAEVQQTSGIRSKIISDFRGWSGDAIFELQNGEVWKQDRYKYKYFSAYRPDATIVKIGSRFVMIVKGHSIRVTRVK